MSNGSDSPYQGPQLPDGFGFNPGQLIPSAPMVFPGEQDLIYLLEFAAEYGGYWVALVSEIVIVILELINELVALFTGKPRSEDTLTVASRLANGISPIAHIMATQIQRNLNQNGI